MRVPAGRNLRQNALGARACQGSHKGCWHSLPCLPVLSSLALEACAHKLAPDSSM